MAESTQSGRQAAYLRLFNRAARNLGRTKPSLDPDTLLQRAVRKTGLSDFGPLGFQEGLRRLSRGLEEQAQLSPIGRIVARFNLVDHLCVRLQLIEYRKRRPEVSKQTITRPLFVLGLPRTGTTILYELLAQDPGLRSPATWEVSRPMPPPQAQGYANDHRIRKVDRLLPVMEQLAPGFKSIHAIGAQLPQECVYMLASHFVSEQFGYMYSLPDYRAWSLDQDMSEAYRWHAGFLQHLQVDCQRPHWVLKSPAHLAYLPYLLGQYPDAAIIWTHRQPLDAMASFSSLASTLHSGFSDAVDPVSVGQHEFAHFARIAERGSQQRETLDTGQFFDASFSAICDDPLAVIADIYQHFGLELSDTARQRMRTYLDRRPRHLYGEHRYTPAAFGLQAEDEQRLYSHYLGKYGQYLR